MAKELLATVMNSPSGFSTFPRRVGTGLRRLGRSMVQQLVKRTAPGKRPMIDDAEFRSSLEEWIASAPAGAIKSHAFVFVPGDRAPWLNTGVDVQAGETFSWLAAGRVVLSRLFDIYFEPDFQLWARIGDGPVFSGTRATHSFTAEHSGRLWLASYAPGQWADPSGKLATPESVYRGLRGGISVLLIRWAGNALAGLESCEPDMHGFRALELDRLTNTVPCPENWNYLWFLGDAEIYCAQTGDNARPEIACITCGDGAILQHDLDVPLERDSRLSWNWRVDQLPSALAEDLLPTHDYMSIAVEFDNGIDLTYYWSAGLPIGTGYWCPLPTWKKREFHVVIRSGAQGLGQWIHEERDLHADYERYIGRPPPRIVRIWLIANSALQREKGCCTYREIRVASPNLDEQVL